MELKDFIKQTILDIATAVQEANEEAKINNLDLVVNPFPIYHKGTPDQCYKEHGDHSSFQPVESIEFDVAVTSSGSIEGGAKGGINVVGFELTGGGKVIDQSSRVSHIKFTIPAVLPLGKK